MKRLFLLPLCLVALILLPCDHVRADDLSGIEAIDYLAFPSELSVAPGRQFSIVLPLNGDDVSLQFSKTELLSEDSATLAETPQGIHPLSLSPRTVYQLTLASSSKSKDALEAIGVAIYDHERKALLVQFELSQDGESTFYTLRDRQTLGQQSGQPQQLVLFKEIEEAGQAAARCGVDESHNSSTSFSREGLSAPTAAASIAGSEVRLGLYLDYCFVQRFGGNVESAVDMALATVALVNEFYRPLLIRHSLAGLVVSTLQESCAQGTETAAQRLSSFRDLWRNVYDPLFPAPMGLAHAISARSWSNSATVQGLAFLPGVCELGFKYGVELFNSGVFSSSGALLLAHELGHNWGAVHCAGSCGIMEPVFVPWAIGYFGPQSATEIQNGLSTASCVQPVQLDLTLPFDESFDQLPYQILNESLWEGALSVRPRPSPVTNFYALRFRNEQSASSTLAAQVVTKSLNLRGRGRGQALKVHADIMRGVTSGSLGAIFGVDYLSNSGQWKSLKEVPLATIGSAQVMPLEALIPAERLNYDGVDSIQVRFRLAGPPGAEAFLDNVRVDVASLAVASIAGGQAMATLDLDADGRDDILLADYRVAGNAGEVRLLSGGSLVQRALLQSAAPGSAFGFALAVLEDLNGDGVPEVAISSPGMEGAATTPGVVALYDGAQLLAGSGQVLWQASGRFTGELFGYALVPFEDTDGDGYRDLLVGAPANAGMGSAGRVVIVSGLTGRELSFTEIQGRQLDDGFGASLDTVGDLDNDAVSDFVVGTLAGKRQLGSGYVQVRSGSTNVLPIFPLIREVLESSFSFPGNTGLTGFGSRVLGLGDFTRDGKRDIAIAAPGPRYFCQVNCLLYQGGMVVIVNALPTSALPVELRGHGLERGFGASLALLDWNKDNRPDLAIGVSNADSYTSNDVGAVQLYSRMGSSIIGGIRVVDKILEHHGSVSGQLLGSAVASGDFDGDGYTDLAITAAGGASEVLSAEARPLSGSFAEGLTRGSGLAAQSVRLPRLRIAGKEAPHDPRWVTLEAEGLDNRLNYYLVIGQGLSGALQPALGIEHLVNPQTSFSIQPGADGVARIVVPSAQNYGVWDFQVLGFAPAYGALVSNAMRADFSR